MLKPADRNTFWRPKPEVLSQRLTYTLKVKRTERSEASSPQVSSLALDGRGLGRGCTTAPCHIPSRVIKLA